MKVLHINCNYMGTVLHQTMIEHLDKYVNENKVFCPIYDGSTLATKPNNNVVVSNCFKKLDRFFFFKKQKKIVDSIEKNIEVNNYNIVHAYTLFTDGNAAYELSKKYGIPYVVAIRATDIEFFQYRVNLRKRGIKILENASAIFFLSNTTRDLLLEKYVPHSVVKNIENKIFIIPNGIDDFWLENQYKDRDLVVTRKRINKREINICCVAQIIKRKNIPLLQRTLELMRNDGWSIQLKVIGKKVDENEFNKVISDNHTIYVPPVKKEELIAFYREADVFVLPSKGETFGLVYAEAMSQGLPVIYSKGEGFDGQFEAGVIGLPIDLKSKDVCLKMSLLLIDILDNYEKYEKNTEDKLEVFRWDNIVRNYSEIYDDILNKG